MDLRKYDPLPVDEPIRKFSHMLEEGQRVRVKETGHQGKLEVINAHQGHVVMLDSGHRVECRDYELEPENFQSRHESASAKASDFAKSYDPIPLEPPGGTGAAVLHKAAGGDYVDELIKAAVDGLNAGHNIVLPSECRIPFMRVPSLKTLVASGRICFDYAG